MTGAPASRAAVAQRRRFRAEGGCGARALPPLRGAPAAGGTGPARGSRGRAKRRPAAGDAGLGPRVPAVATGGAGAGAGGGLVPCAAALSGAQGPALLVSSRCSARVPASSVNDQEIIEQAGFKCASIRVTWKEILFYTRKYLSILMEPENEGFGRS